MAEITLANRKNPLEMASWSEGQKPLLGTDGFATATEMLEAAGLAGWKVTKQPIVVAGTGLRVPGRWATVAQIGDERVVLGDVGNLYVPRQPEETFAFGDNIVDSGEAKWERAGKVRGGKVIFGAMELCHLGISVPGDDSDIKPYLLLVDSFDGSTHTEGIVAYIRPVCDNTFEMARGTDTQYRFAIRHTGTLDGKIQMARDAIGIAFKHNAEVKELVTRMALTSIVDEQVLDIFRTTVWPVNIETIGETRLENHASTRAYENYLTSPTIEGVRGTVWGAFNAVTEFTDHIATYSGEKEVTEDSSRADAILFGRAQMRKDRAMEAFLPLLK